MTDSSVVRAIEFATSALENEIRYLIDSEGYVDDRIDNDDDFDQDEDIGVTEAETYQFYQQLIEDIESGVFAPTTWDEINACADQYYAATEGGAMYGDTDGAEHIAENLAKIFLGIVYDDEEDLEDA